MDVIRLTIFESRLAALCETMGAVLRRSAFSPNIRDRLDFSCALFDDRGRLLSQATHIPVHLGSMAWAMSGLAREREWAPGERMILNDPYRGGTHLPDVTVIAPVFAAGRLAGFVANRAHHADIGGEVTGSMPVSSRLEQEGTLIEPVLLCRDGRIDEAILDRITRSMRSPALSRADFHAQIAASAAGERIFSALLDEYGMQDFTRLSAALNGYARRLALGVLEQLPVCRVAAEDCMDDDGLDGPPAVIRVTLDISPGALDVDFSGTQRQVAGNLNCPLSVTAAAVYYVFRCLLPTETPDCAGSLEPIVLRAPDGSLVNARAPAAVAAGNVETSQRIVDVLLRALDRAIPGRIPAASQGTMNNFGIGGNGWSYYETIAGGCGAADGVPGRHAVHSHMTNTLNTPVEVLENSYPLRVVRYQRRRQSGGGGRFPGGDGVIREYEFTADAEISLITERRRFTPWGLAGGNDGCTGMQLLDGHELPSKVAMAVRAGQRLRIETPGGGGFG